MEEINTILGYEDSLKIIQNKDNFRFSLDSTFLAFFTEIKKKTDRIIDLGSGNGAIPLFLSMFTTKPIFGIELQEEVALMAKRSVELNNLENQIKIINGDIKNIKDYFLSDSFGLVLSNPPYFKVNHTSSLNEKEEISLARHEITVTMEDIVKASFYLLKEGGTLSMVQSTDRFSETIFLLKKYNFYIKRLRFVYPSKGKESYIFLFDAGKRVKEQGIKILEPLYVYNDNNEYTDEVKAYFHYGENNGKK
ncbi:MAG: tRNA1(Val) (adenine(37)-N6)-methyltransferase [Bacillales bacterium]|nr:tRNA1(Val) (adenine(37)-N6)-methyltransferase [Bacillales bacterium]